jgi:voltage-gated sodium channel
VPLTDTTLVVGEEVLRQLLREELRGELREALREVLPGPSSFQQAPSKLDAALKLGEPGDEFVDFEVDTDTTTASLPANATAGGEEEAEGTNQREQRALEYTDGKAKGNETKSQKTASLSTTRSFDPPTFSQAMQKLVPDPVTDRLDRISHLEEPHRTGPLAELVDSGKFETLSCSVIVLNAIMSFIITNYEMDNRGAPPPWAILVETAFVAFYCIELGLRLYVHRLYFFCNSNVSWNIFDFLLVCTATYNLTLAAWIRGNQGMKNMSFMRTLRLLRMTKVLRVLRLMRCIAELRLILNSLLASMASLFWSIVTMSLIFYIFGLLLVQNAVAYINEQDGTLDAQTEGLLYASFGSVQGAMLSLFKSTTGGGDWTVYYDLFTPMGLQASSLFLFFIAFSQVAFLNILTGLFVDSAMKLSEPDRERFVAESRRAFAKQRQELEAIMEEMDLDGDGTISEAEFFQQMQLKNGKLQAYLESVGVHAADAEHFFSMLKSASLGHGVETVAFVEGCLQLRGEASSLHLQAVATEVKNMHKKIAGLSAEVQKSVGPLGRSQHDARSKEEGWMV